MTGFPSFDAFFYALWHTEPFRWQRRLADTVIAGSGWPGTIAAPTGAGKTAVIDMWTWAVAAGAVGVGPHQPRRLFFVIDRRIVVDSVFDRAQTIAAALTTSDDPEISAVANALRDLDGLQPLLATRLRGGLDLKRSRADRSWAESLTQPLVCATTVDQLGSRLLFRGYGLSRWRRNPLPIHAALVGNDALIVVDEAHLAVPFEETLRRVEQLRRAPGGELGLPWRTMSMTATPRPGATAVFAFDDDDLADPLLSPRLESSKLARLVEVAARRGTDSLVVAAIAETRTLLEDITVRTAGVVVNRVARARAVADGFLALGLDADVLLLIGPSRPADRERAIDENRTRLMADKRIRNPDDRRLIVVATQTIEVGADLDFDALVTECASADALRQRFGRLDRLGRRAGEARAAILYRPEKEPDPVYGSTLEPTWRWLRAQEEEGVVDVGWRALSTPPAEALSPSLHAPLLFSSYLDRLSQTSPLPAVEPAVSTLLHGFDAAPADVEIVWRADLDPDEIAHWREIVALAPPSGREALRVSITVARRWLEGLTPGDVADVEGVADETGNDMTATAARVLRWCGPSDSGTVPIAPVELRPGDTIVVPAARGGCDRNGWAPGSKDPVFDLTELLASERAAPILRLHRDVLAQYGVDLDVLVPDGLFIADEDDSSVRVPDHEAIRGLVSSLAQGDSELAPVAQRLDNGTFQALAYPDFQGADPRGVLLSIADEPAEVGDDVGSTAGATGEVLLSDHQRHVGEKAVAAARAVRLDSIIVRAIELAAKSHDEGKRDSRFQQFLAGGNPLAETSQPIAKGRLRVPDRTSIARAWRQADLPRRFRHEAVSVVLLEEIDEGVDRDLVLHLIASHHGCARPYLPTVGDTSLQQLADTSPLERVDGAVPERFWRLSRRFGWWGLAYLETVLRLADHRQSAEEQSR